MADPRPPLAYRFILASVRLLVRAFFRRVHVIGRENVPAEGGGIVVSWHPNGLVDPVLILTHLPRRVVFGARHGLFRWPLLGALMRAVGTVPIYRAVDRTTQDPAARAAANARSLDALAAAVAAGSFSALFPEGVSHDEPHPVELKTGAARLYYRARELQAAGAPPAVIVPVGLHYDSKDLFRSSALVELHPPLQLPAELAPRAGLDEEAQRAQVRLLTDEIERELHDAVHATDSWALHRVMQRARKLIRAERARRLDANPGRVAIDERVLGFARIRKGYYARLASHPEEVQALTRRVDEYDADLAALRLEDHELDRAPRLGSAWLALALLLQVLTVYLLLPPLLIVGYAVNAPGALLLIAISNLAAKRKKDEASIKLLVGALLFPLSWIAAGLLAAWGSGWVRAIYPNLPDRPGIAFLMVALLAAAGGAAALRYLRLARETARAVRVRLTRKLRGRAIERLRAERAALHDAILSLAEGLELPGAVAADGRIVRDRDEPLESLREEQLNSDLRDRDR